MIPANNKHETTCSIDVAELELNKVLKLEEKVETIEYLLEYSVAGKNIPATLLDPPEFVEIDILYSSIVTANNYRKVSIGEELAIKMYLKHSGTLVENRERMTRFENMFEVACHEHYEKVLEQEELDHVEFIFERNFGEHPV